MALPRALSAESRTAVATASSRSGRTGSVAGGVLLVGRSALGRGAGGETTESDDGTGVAVAAAGSDTTADGGVWFDRVATIQAMPAAATAIKPVPANHLP